MTSRLEIRPPVEADRERFVDLFCDDEFMIFFGVLEAPAAHRRFDQMLLRAEELPFAKQPVIERDTGRIVGYSGVDWFPFEGDDRLEFGYRLVPEARGQGYATEAGQAIVSKAEDTFHGEILAMIGSTNSASQNVARKLGFTYWKQANIDGSLDNIYRLQIGRDPV